MAIDKFKAIKDITDAGNASSLGLLKEAKKPVGKIAQSPQNANAGRAGGLAGWYQMNPQAVQGESYQQEHDRTQLGLKRQDELDAKAHELALAQHDAEIAKAKFVPPDPAQAQTGLTGVVNDYAQTLKAGGANFVGPVQPGPWVGQPQEQPQPMGPTNFAGGDPGSLTRDPQVQNLVNLANTRNSLYAESPSLSASAPPDVVAHTSLTALAEQSKARQAMHTPLDMYGSNPLDSVQPKTTAPAPMAPAAQNGLAQLASPVAPDKWHDSPYTGTAPQQPIQWPAATTNSPGLPTQASSHIANPGSGLVGYANSNASVNGSDGNIAKVVVPGADPTQVHLYLRGLGYSSEQANQLMATRGVTGEANTKQIQASPEFKAKSARDATMRADYDKRKFQMPVPKTFEGTGLGALINFINNH